MEYLPGGSLAGRLKGGPLPINEVIALARQVLDALALLHRSGVVHRDVKPSNLLFDGDGSVKLADLGLVRALDEASDLTAADLALGTPAYMSPEQRVGGAVGPPADLYGLGLTLIEALTGVRPGRQGIMETVPSDCPRWLRRFVARLLEARPADRWPDAGAALRAFEARRGLVSPRVRRQVAAASLASLAVIGILAVVVALRGPDLEGASARVDGSRLALYDRSGRRLWETELGGRARAVLTADLVGDRAPEVAVAVQRGTEGPERPVALEVYSGRGRLVTRVEREGSAFIGQWPGMSSSTGDWKLFDLAVEPGAGPWLGWMAYHTTWYPVAFGLWDVRRGVGPWTLLRNAGHLHGVTAADLDGHPPTELVLTGVNNPLGYQSVVVIVRPTRRPGLGPPSFSSPDDLLTLRQEKLDGLAPDQRPVYTLLGSSGVLPRVVAAGRDGLTLAVGAETVRLDAWGNPAGGPLEGAGPLHRQRYWDDLRALCQGIEEGTSHQGELEDFEADNAEVLGEPPHRVAAEVMLARSLARAGRDDEAVARLEGAVVAHPQVNDLRLRLGEQLVIGGYVRRGVEELLACSSERVAGRVSLDPLLDLAHVATARADEELLARLGNRLEVYFSTPGDPHALAVPALVAFARGRYDDPALDQGARPHLLPMVAVLRCWAKLERGAALAEVTVEAEDLARDPEISTFAALLQAHALTRQGQGGRARGLAESALSELDRRGRTEIAAFVWRGLAHRVLADACRAAGDEVCAETHQRLASELAPRTWFGAADGSR